jgi:hypothetical protein
MVLAQLFGDMRVFHRRYKNSVVDTGIGRSGLEGADVAGCGQDAGREASKDAGKGGETHGSKLQLVKNRNLRTSTNTGMQ